MRVASSLATSSRWVACYGGNPVMTMTSRLRLVTKVLCQRKSNRFSMELKSDERLGILRGSHGGHRVPR